MPVMGLNTSAELRRDDPSCPPAIKTPEIEHNNVHPLTVSQGGNCNLPGILKQKTPAPSEASQFSIVLSL